MGDGIRRLEMTGEATEVVQGRGIGVLESWGRRYSWKGKEVNKFR